MIRRPPRSTLSLHDALPISQDIADKNFLPEEVASHLEHFVKSYMKPSKGAAGHGLKTMERKRKSDFNAHDISEDDKPAKKLKKTAALPVRKASTVAKTPKTHKKR